MKVARILMMIGPLLLSAGCFTGTNRSASAWSGDGSVPLTAVGLDLVTAPVQVPFWILGSVSYIPDSIRAKKERQFRRSFLEDASFRERFIYSTNFTRHNLDLLHDRQMADVLSEEDVRYLWDSFKDVDGRALDDSLITARNTPPDVLTEYYWRVLEKAERRKQNYARELACHFPLIFHPNLPPEILADLRSYSDPYIDRTLNERERSVGTR